MHAEFWHDRWRQNQIGFHNDEINLHLQQHWPVLQVDAGRRVFVPLCGKSNDMLWLLSQNHPVVGVELSPIAVSAFFSENNIPASTRKQNRFTVHETDGLTLYCGDFFDLSADDLAGVTAVYDRASLVALPSDMRRAYTEHLRGLLESGSTILLIAFDYPQHEMDGPPFCVPTEEVQTLYRDWCRVELLCSEELLDREPRFKERGLTRMQEQVYRLTVY